MPSEAPGGLPELHGIKHRLDVVDDAGEIFQNRSLKKRKGRGAGSALKTSFFFFTFSTNDSYFSRGAFFLHQRAAAPLGEEMLRLKIKSASSTPRPASVTRPSPVDRHGGGV